MQCDKVGPTRARDCQKKKSYIPLDYFLRTSGSLPLLWLCYADINYVINSWLYTLLVSIKSFNVSSLLSRHSRSLLDAD